MKKLTVYIATGSLSINAFQKELIRIHPFFTWTDTKGCWQDDKGNICHEASCTVNFLLGPSDHGIKYILTQIRIWLGSHSKEQQIAYDEIDCKGGLLNTIE